MFDAASANSFDELSKNLEVRRPAGSRCRGCAALGNMHCRQHNPRGAADSWTARLLSEARGTSVREPSSNLRESTCRRKPPPRGASPHRRSVARTFALRQVTQGNTIQSDSPRILPGYLE